MTKAYYPAVFHIEEDNKGYYVEFPDIQGCLTNGKTLEEAFEMAKEVLGLFLYQKGDEYDIVPSSPSTIHDIQKAFPNELVLLIEFDPIAYTEKYNLEKLQNLNHYVYPAIFSYEEGKEIAVDFPDLHAATSGMNEEDALLSAKELLHVVLKGLLEDGEDIPTPTPLPKVTLEKNEQVVLVDVYMPIIFPKNK